MELSYILIGLLVIAIILFILSFFQTDHYKLLREELEQFTLQQIQEGYIIKKKLNILEEELLISDNSFGQDQRPRNITSTVNEILQSQVLSLAKQGASVEQISNQSSLTVTEVRTILSAHGLRGNQNE